VSLIRIPVISGVTGGTIALAMFVSAGPMLAHSPDGRKAGATEAQAARSAVVASGEGETPGLRVDITEFKRTSGDTLTLRMTIVNGSSVRLSNMALGDSRYDISANGIGIGGIHLLDVVGKRKYFVARDTANQCVCSRLVRDVQPGGSLNVWAKFAAPPADVERLTIVIPGFMPIEDVPVSR
jgi:hypothetical protein